MRLVERHIVRGSRFEDICLKSGLLYNYVLYNVRQGIFSGDYLKEYEFSTKLCKDNQFDFRNLPTSVSQQVVGKVFKDVRLWIKLKKDFEKNPSKYNNRRPCIPKYKKGNKQNIVIFTTSACRLKDDSCIHFVNNIIDPIKTNIKNEELKQVRIIPQATCYVVEVIYERKEMDLNLNKSNFLSIDLGLNNLCSCISNVDTNPFIINGRVIKSVNQWYNKEKSVLMSFVGDKGTSCRINKITLYRNLFIEDKLHKISRYIINFCISNNIGKVIIGLNKEWKQEINIGKRNNQHFVSIPHSKLIDKITYKAKLIGIEVVIHEESYTSKVDHLAFESLNRHDVYIGKRIKRGLFQSSIGKLLNADINGAIGIARKVIGDSCIDMIIGSGLAFNPIRVNIL